MTKWGFFAESKKSPFFYLERTICHDGARVYAQVQGIHDSARIQIQFLSVRFPSGSIRPDNGGWPGDRRANNTRQWDTRIHAPGIPSRA